MTLPLALTLNKPEESRHHHLQFLPPSLVEQTYPGSTRGHPDLVGALIDPDSGRVFSVQGSAVSIRSRRAILLEDVYDEDEVL